MTMKPSILHDRSHTTRPSTMIDDETNAKRNISRAFVLFVVNETHDENKKKVYFNPLCFVSLTSVLLDVHIGDDLAAAVVLVFLRQVMNF